MKVDKNPGEKLHIKASFDACYRLEGIDSEEEIGSEEGFLVKLVVCLVGGRIVYELL